MRECSCRWKVMVHPLNLHGDVSKYLAYRDPECLTHGDTTVWWARITERARQLAARHEAPAPRCPVCGGLNPGDQSHVRCM